MKKVFSLACILLLLSSCSLEASLEQQLAKILVTINEKEQLTTGYVKKLNRYEQKEQLLFRNTMELTQERYVEVNKLVIALKKSASERMSLIEKEQQVIQDAKREVDAITNLLDDFSPENKQQIIRLVAALRDRYAMHEQFITKYKQQIDLQTRLYAQLTNRSVQADVLEERVQEVNRLAVELKETVEGFNEATSEVNRLKSRALASLESSK